MPVIPIIGAAASYALYAGVASAAISIGGSLIGGAQQSAAMNQQAEFQQQQAQQAQAIANYNAETQRQNNEVAYQMALYQSQANQQMSAINQAMAMQNAAFAEVQAYGARQQYEQGLANAEQERIQAEAARAQGREAVNRERQDNDKRLALIRGKYGASGVTPEGSPLEVLGDAAKLGELAVQDDVAFEHDPAQQFRRERWVPWSIERDLVFLLDLVTRMGETLREITVVRQDQQSLALRVEPSHVEQARSVRREEIDSKLRGVGPSGYAESRVRPFARRRVMIRRPARVRIRIRKPWVFFRWRLFGW
jgi:hypothetical protein